MPKGIGIGNSQKIANQMSRIASAAQDITQTLKDSRLSARTSQVRLDLGEKGQYALLTIDSDCGKAGLTGEYQTPDGRMYTISIQEV